MRRANGIPHFCNDLDEILHALPHLSKKCFDEVLTSAPYPLSGSGGLNSQKPKRTFLKNCVVALTPEGRDGPRPIQNRERRSGYKEYTLANTFFEIYCP